MRGRGVSEDQFAGHCGEFVGRFADVDVLFYVLRVVCVMYGVERRMRP